MASDLVSYPQIIAERSDGALLVALDARDGCIYLPSRKVVYPPLALVSLTAQPYWHAYQGSQDVLRDWPGPLSMPSFPRPESPPDDAA